MLVTERGFTELALAIDGSTFEYLELRVEPAALRERFAGTVDSSVRIGFPNASSCLIRARARG